MLLGQTVFYSALRYGSPCVGSYIVTNVAASSGRVKVKFKEQILGHYAPMHGGDWQNPAAFHDSPQNAAASLVPDCKNEMERKVAEHDKLRASLQALRELAAA